MANNSNNQYKQQTVKLNRIGKRDCGWKKCPNCEARCSGYENYETGAYWCYVCGWRSGMKLQVNELVEKVKTMSRPKPTTPVETRPVGKYLVVRSY